MSFADIQTFQKVTISDSHDEAKSLTHFAGALRLRCYPSNVSVSVQAFSPDSLQSPLFRDQIPDNQLRPHHHDLGVVRYNYLHDHIPV